MVAATKPGRARCSAHDPSTLNSQAHPAIRAHPSGSADLSAHTSWPITATITGLVSSLCLVAVCTALLVGNGLEERALVSPSFEAGFETIDPSLTTHDVSSAVDHGRSPHNLYRFSGVRAAVASMNHGF